MQVTNPAHLVGKFNLHLRDCILLFADEAFYAGDKQHEGVLKAIITEPTLVIEGKGQNVVIAANMLHVVMASNSDWVVPASAKERRYFALDVAETHIGNHAYFKAIEGQMQAGGAAAMLHDLLERDLSGFEVRKVPQTNALRAQKTLSLGSLPSWWLAVLEREHVYVSKFANPVFAEWLPFYATQLLYRSYQQWCDQNRRHTRSSEVELGKFMTKLAQKQRPSGDHPVGEHPVGEIEYPDREILKAGGSLAQNGVDVRPRPPGYSVGNLAEARGAFQEVYDGIDADWAVNP